MNRGRQWKATKVQCRPCYNQNSLWALEAASVCVEETGRDLRLAFGCLQI